MITFLFWNIQKKPLQSTIAYLARLHKVDVVILAECDNEMTVLQELNNIETHYHFLSSDCPKIKCFSVFKNTSFYELKATRRMSIRQFMSPTQEIMVCMVHLSDALNNDEGNRLIFAKDMSAIIREVERNIGHSNTMVIGDFNMNPFDSGMTKFGGFNAVMNQAIAYTQYRTVQGEKYEYFYNPMWGRFGDLTPQPSGTIYYRHSDCLWNMYDQVLLRPALLSTFDNTNLHILDSIEPNDRKLVTRNKLPNKNIYSDHLPLLIRLNIGEKS